MPDLSFTALWPIVQVVMEPLWPYFIGLAGLAATGFFIRTILQAFRS